MRYYSEILTIGDEILIGHTVNGNAAYLGKALAGAGVPAKWGKVVSDDYDEIQTALKYALSRADVIVITGGLGPTPDDLTQKAVADYFGLPIEEDAELLAHVESIFARLTMKVPEQSKNQALFPVGAYKIHNPKGTATGFHIERDGKHIFALPGVPYEMQSMSESYVIPQIRENFPSAKHTMKTLRMSGIGESQLMEKLAPLDELYQSVKLAFLPNQGLLDFRLTALSEDKHEAELQIADAESFVRSRVGDCIYGTGDTSLAQVIGNILTNRGQTLSVAESCTGGMVAAAFTDISGSSRWFERGWVTYSNAAKIEELAVGALKLTQEGAVSEAVVLDMASGARRHGGATWGIGVTGIAGPGGGSAEKPVGTVWIACSSELLTTAKVFHFGGDRELIRTRARNAAMFMLYKRLMEV